MIVRCLPRAIVFVAAVAVSLGCARRSSSHSSATAPPSVSVRPLAALAAAVDSSAAAARKRVADLVPPPLTPPADAESRPDGLRYRIVQGGVGQPVGPDDLIQADFSIWAQSGALAFSTYERRNPFGLSAATIPPLLFDVLAPVPAGSKVWLWLPAALARIVKQQRPQLPFPDAAVVVEYEPVEVTHRPAPSSAAAEPVASVSSAAPARFPEPDAAGPPKSAASTPNGLRYVMLAPGSGTTKPKPDDRLSLRLTLWPLTGLVVAAPLYRDQASATTLQRAPAGLGQVLGTMTDGSVARVWLPQGKAQQVAPVPAGHEAVLDVTLERIE